LIDWNELIRKGEIADSPGRQEACQVCRYKATFREGKPGSEHVEVIAAMSYHGALRKLKGRTKRLLSLVKINDEF
jgi:hypothetical protein